MKGIVTVKAVRKSSREAVKGKKVALGIDAFFSGGVTDIEWTDSEGEAQFSVNPGCGKVFVDGSTKYEGQLSGRVVVYI